MIKLEDQIYRANVYYTIIIRKEQVNNTYKTIGNNNFIVNIKLNNCEHRSYQLTTRLECDRNTLHGARCQ